MSFWMGTILAIWSPGWLELLSLFFRKGTMMTIWTRPWLDIPVLVLTQGVQLVPNKEEGMLAG